MILMVGICFTMTSCTKEKSIKGTTWIGVVSFESHSITYTLSFYESTYSMEGKYSFEDDPYTVMSGTYTYNDPVVILNINEENRSVSGTVSGNKLSLDGIIFEKK